MLDKLKNVKAWIAIAVILLICLIAFFVLTFSKPKGQTPTTENEVINVGEDANVEEETTPPVEEQLEEVENSIQENPTDPENYSEKSNLLYQQGDKEGALQAVNDGLAVNPDDELLKSKKDTLEKEYYNDSEATGSRQ